MDSEAKQSISVKMLSNFVQMSLVLWNLVKTAHKNGIMASLSAYSALSSVSTISLISFVRNLSKPFLYDVNSKSAGFLLPLTSSAGISISYLNLA
jgi:hypothetical protein